MATPYMNLTLPTPTITLGPLWATQINTALSGIDAHDHSNAKGKQIPSSGLNINAELDLNANSFFNALSLKFSSQIATLIGASNASSIYVVNGNLYYTNSAGTAVQITNGGTLAATPGAAQTFERLDLSADLTIAPSDTVVFISTDTSASRTITMPAVSAITNGRFYIIKDNNGNAYNLPITISPNGSDTFDGQSSLTLDSSFGSIILVGDGVSNWQLS